MEDRVIDLTLLKAVQKGDHLAFAQLSKQCEHLIYYQVSRYYLVLEKDDLTQEALLALYKAALSYDFKQSQFQTYATTVIRNTLISRFRHALSDKQSSLNEAKSLEQTLPDTHLSLAHSLPVKQASTEEILLKKERKKELDTLCKTHLSQREYAVFTLYLSDFSYKEIASRLSLELRQVDNAIQRAKKKMLKLCKQKGID